MRRNRIAIATGAAMVLSAGLVLGSVSAASAYASDANGGGEIVLTLVPAESPTEPEQPVDPTEPTQPIEPTEPTEPVQPVEPVGPAQPIQPVVPAHPSEPTHPVAPSEPQAPIAVDLTDLTPGGTATASTTVTNAGSAAQDVWVSFPDPEALSAVNAGVAAGWLTVSISVDGNVAATTSGVQQVPAQILVADDLATGASTEVAVEVALSPEAPADAVTVAALPFEVKLADSGSTTGA